MEGLSKIYPLTIVADRYGGSYSGALFTAWNLQYDQLPGEISDCDLGCGIFWTKADRSEIGFGSNPNEAYQDLLEKLQVKKLKEQEALEHKLRNLRHLTQEEFCDKIGISDTHYRKIEAGSRTGSLELIVEMAEYFHVSLDYLLLGEMESNSKAKKDILAVIESLTKIAREL